MDTDILEDLGLTASEIKTYTALLELGSSTAGPLLQHSGLQNSVIHRALHSLIEKGLISYILEGKRRIYQATDPENFYQFIERKKQRFSQLLPELKKLQIFAKPHEAATIYKGKRGIQEVYYKLINLPAKEYNTFGGGKQCAQFMGITWWLNLHQKRIANTLPSRQVFDETVRPAGGNEIAALSLTTIRYLSAEFSQFQETVIVGDHVAITVFAEHGYSFLIADQKVADGYKKYFEVLWKLAKA